jgi:hypothetical protein
MNDTLLIKDATGTESIGRVTLDLADDGGITVELTDEDGTSVELPLSLSETEALIAKLAVKVAQARMAQ